MLRRLHSEQPDVFAFTPGNQKWAEAQITKYPEGRQASAIIPLLWRAQEQEGWLSRPAIEHVAAMLDLAFIRALEVASFYFMFQLKPVGSVANFQICGTTTCMICGAEDLIAVCREKIAPRPHTLSSDGKFSWEEVECLGACSNAPMAQIGKDYYEDLTAERFAEMIDEFAAGKVPVPGPQNGRFACEPASGLTSLSGYAADKPEYNASVALATDLGDTIKRIDGTEVPLLTPWNHGGAANSAKPPKPRQTGATAAQQSATKKTANAASGDKKKAHPKAEVQVSKGPGTKPQALEGPRDGKADNLKLIKGVGPKLEQLLNDLGFWHFDQVANWTPDELAWVDQNLAGFKGRVSRDDWVTQAKMLAKGGKTEFSQRAQKEGKYNV